MSEYRIEKVRHRVAVSLTNRRLLEGDIFLQPFARFRAGPEDPLDVLNNEDPFLPLSLVAGELLLVQKSQITMVAVALPSGSAEPSLGTPSLHIECSLSDDTTLRGQVFPELRADRPRLVDFLNHTQTRFFTVFGSEQRLLVAHAHIVSARPVP
jgi:hypothetical protein